ncbi:hypothetical protein [Streptosporangium minutum]|uniref:hypothetical protein n=1 Tax=Streptosporangium minutum TaxID=569862 RepID=UPI000A36B4C3|nr:hypothetical protein [Streptosporangium minutum]
MVRLKPHGRLPASTRLHSDHLGWTWSTAPGEDAPLFAHAAHLGDALHAPVQITHPERRGGRIR